VIIITGVGRSGTSLVARLYHEFGLDPGGSWDRAINAGLEDPEVVGINRTLMRELGVGLPLDTDLAERPLVTRDDGGLDAREPGTGLLDRPAVKLPTRIVPGPLRRAVRRRGETFAGAVRRRLRDGLSRRRAVDQPAVGRAAERHGDTLRRVAAAREVVKDPRFAWTLGAWATAGARIDHVVVCRRDIAASVESRIAAGHYLPEQREAAATALEQGERLCFEALREHGIEHAVVDFPEMLDAPDSLFAAMRLPAAVTRERFGEAFERVRDPRLVHHGGA
jgi:hypothetical protein